MTQYVVEDFSESLERAKIERTRIQAVVAAWGTTGTMNEWKGGFLLEMVDRTWIYLTGWCDTTGWGCQGGIDIDTFVEQPNLDDLERKKKRWDRSPADLNRFLVTGGKKWDDRNWCFRNEVDGGSVV